MWGPLIQLRQWLRPLPQVGWVFRARLVYETTHGSGRFFETEWPGHWTGVERDIRVPILDAEAAITDALIVATEMHGRDVEIVAMRPADRRDIPDPQGGLTIGPGRYVGPTHSGGHV